MRLERIETMNKKNVLPHAGGGGRLSTGFTMAEILLSLTIIGVVAAITLPSLTGNINERTWNTQRKALYARFSQAISLMPALNGYGADNADTATEIFVTAGLSKVLKINNICDNEHLGDCGFASSYTNMAGSTKTLPTTLYELNINFSSAVGHGLGYSQADTKAAAFETANGESILAFYNPACQQIMELTAYHTTQQYMCANFIYDLNGSKGPNAVGKDIGFMSAFQPSDSFLVAPMPIRKISGGYTLSNAIKTCTQTDSESRLPNWDEMASMYYNRDLLDVDTLDSTYYWTSTMSAGKRWFMHMGTGIRYPGESSTASHAIMCIKR